VIFSCKGNVAVSFGNYLFYADKPRKFLFPFPTTGMYQYICHRTWWLFIRYKSWWEQL